MTVPNLSLYCVSDWQTYQLILAKSPEEALFQIYKKHYNMIDNFLLNEETVVHAMCCEYKGYAETILERYTSDIDRVLFLDSYENTLRYQAIP